MSSKKLEPYIYRIEYIATGEFYIGSHTTGSMIGDGYYTNAYHPLIRERFLKCYMNEWRIEIISEIGDDAPGDKAKVALVIENILIKKHFDDPKNLNGYYHDVERGHGFCRNQFKSKPPSRKGAKHSEESKRRMSLQNTGRVHTSEALANLQAGAIKAGLKRRGKPSLNHSAKSMQGLQKGRDTCKRRAPYIKAVREVLKYLSNEMKLANPNTPSRNKKAILANRRRHIQKFGSAIYKHHPPK